MTPNRDPVKLVAKAAGMKLDLLKIASLAENKSTYFYSDEDNFASFNYYRSVANLADIYRHQHYHAMPVK